MNRILLESRAVCTSGLPTVIMQQIIGEMIPPEAGRTTCSGGFDTRWPSIPSCVLKMLVAAVTCHQLPILRTILAALHRVIVAVDVVLLW